MRMGEETFWPRIVVAVSSLLTSTRVLGMIRRRAKASRFSRNVIMSLLPEAICFCSIAVKRQDKTGSCGSRAKVV